MKLKLKIVCAAALIAMGAAVQADPIYLDLGKNYNLSALLKHAGPNSTQLINSFLYKYDSRTVITDTNLNGVLDTGDTTVGSGGLLKLPGVFPTTDGFARNNISNADPTFSFSTGSNDFGASWGLSLGWNDLVGTFSGGGVSYSSGSINIYLLDLLNGLPPAISGVGSALHVLTLNVTSGGNNGINQSLNLRGSVTVVNGTVDIGDVGGTTVADLFNFEGGTSFDDVIVSFRSNQNTEPFWLNGVAHPDTGLTFTDVCTFYGGVAIACGGSGSTRTTGLLEGEHDGSVSFSQVPEPGTLAMLGLGLIGVAFSRRRKSA